MQWYQRAARPLPWRLSEPDPYSTWLSEVMAQQTRVDTLIPYWERFLERWPRVEDRAAAELDEVLGEWAGLGYYSRARNLHRAAQRVAELGAFPSTAKALKALPGVGDYTAAAIASIAFGEDVALVDGNVERVLTRFHRFEGDPRTPANKRTLWGLAQRDLLAGSAGDYNQALMELGATLCSPRAPRCLLCPLRADCAGQDIAERLPNKPKKKKAPQVFGACILVRREGRALLCRRPDTGLLAGLWELPGVERAAEVEEVGALVSGLQDRLGLQVHPKQRLGQVRHVFTHRRLEQGVWEGEVDPGPLKLRHYSAALWVSGEDIEALALSTLARKCLKVAGLI